MRLLLTTQKLDQNDDVLGFMHGWVIALAKTVEHVTVICLFKGNIDLPANVTVYSLGKEERQSRVQYVRRFFRALWHARGTYDTVLVHMNIEYLLLAGWLWRLTGKRVGIWYNHRMGSTITRIACRFAHRVFHTSEHAFTASLPRAMRMPVGVDTTLFMPSPTVARDPNAILYIGRIAPIKRLEILIQSLLILQKESIPFTLDVYGSATVQDIAYYRTLRELSKPLELAGLVKFHGSIANRFTPPIFQAHAILANMSPDGLFDKTIIEGIASGCMVSISNTSLRGVLPPFSIFKQDDVAEMVHSLKTTLALSAEERTTYVTALRAHIETHESLATLLTRVTTALERP